MTSEKIFADVALQYGGPHTRIAEIDLGARIDSVLLKNNKLRQRKSSFGASGFSYLCPVQRAFQIQEDRWDIDSFTPEQMRAMLGGTGIHEEMQKEIYPDLNMFGHWKSPDGSDLVEYTRYSELPEDKKDYLYEEMYLKWDDLSPGEKTYRLAGKVDGLMVDEGTDSWYIVEMKTVTDDMFNGCYRRKSKQEGVHKEIIQQPSRLPLDGHVFQAQIYAGLIHKLGLDEKIPASKCGGVIIMYISRDSVLDKEYVLPYDPRSVETAISIIENVKNAATPLSLVKKCSNRNSTKAKTCPWRDECFPRARRSSTKK